MSEEKCFFSMKNSYGYGTTFFVCSLNSLRGLKAQEHDIAVR